MPCTWEPYTPTLCDASLSNQYAMLCASNGSRLSGLGSCRKRDALAVNCVLWCLPTAVCPISSTCCPIVPCAWRAFVYVLFGYMHVPDLGSGEVREGTGWTQCAADASTYRKPSACSATPHAWLSPCMCLEQHSCDPRHPLGDSARYVSAGQHGPPSFRGRGR